MTLPVSQAADCIFSTDYGEDAGGPQYIDLGGADFTAGPAKVFKDSACQVDHEFFASHYLTHGLAYADDANPRTALAICQANITDVTINLLWQPHAWFDGPNDPMQDKVWDCAKDEDANQPPREYFGSVGDIDNAADALASCQALYSGADRVVQRAGAGTSWECVTDRSSPPPDGQTPTATATATQIDSCCLAGWNCTFDFDTDHGEMGLRQ